MNKCSQLLHINQRRAFSKRIFVFGLDGATWKLINRWIIKGYLPFFKQLARQGVKRDLISTIPSRTAPAWASFITGKNPGEHGVYDFLIKQNLFNQKKEKLVNGSCLGKNKFWKQWPKKRIGLINLPLTYPIEKINGVVITSFLTPKRASWVYPPRLAKKLHQWHYGREEISFLEEYGRNQSKKEIYQKILSRLEARFNLIENLIQEDNFDFFFTLFRAPDLTQHLFWRGRQTLEIYRRLDGFLATLYQNLVKKYGARHFYFFIISDHGFHPAPKIQVNLYPWLRKRGLLPSTPKIYLARILRKIYFWQKDKTESQFNQWGKSQLLVVDNFGIYLNKKLLGKKYQEYRKKLIQELNNLFYQKKRIFQLVAPREEIYWGKRVKQAPDVVFITRPYFAVGTGAIETKIFLPRRISLLAHHDSDRRGIFLAKGVGLKRILKDWQDRDLYIWDLPAIFKRIFAEQEGRKNQIKTKEEIQLITGEEEIMKKRLKALGYL